MVAVSAIVVRSCNRLLCFQVLSNATCRHMRQTQRCFSSKSVRNLSSVQPQHQFDDDDDDYEEDFVHHPARLRGVWMQEQDPMKEESPIRSQELSYVGNERIPITSHLHIVPPEEDSPRGTWPAFRIMDEDGTFRCHFRFNSAFNAPPITQLEDLVTHYPDLENNPLLTTHIVSHEEEDDDDKVAALYRAHKLMIRLREMDTIFQNAQRQGRISFYMTCRGEEAIHFGAGVALDKKDVVLAQYREAGVLMWRGFTLQQFANQCFTNKEDLSKGRQMPIHYGSRALHYQTISSPLGTQLPQAVGVAYRFKLQQQPNVSICFFGEGCASTVDFHSACNFASTLKVPVLFVCRNNGYAISTPASEQYAGDGIISRCKGYGMAGIRVDGNDVFAVAAAIQEARAYALQHQAPVLVECMTYRQGHHSTSDDSTRYRNVQEVQTHESYCDPLLRLNKFLEQHEIVNETQVQDIEHTEKKAVLKAMETAEALGTVPLEEMFQDVYHSMPSNLKKQEQELKEHLSNYPK